MKCEARFGLAENLGKWPCRVCRKGVGSNGIKYNQCSQWIHERFTDVSGKLKNAAGFRCTRCVDGQLFREVVAMEELMISSLDKLKCIDKFCYLETCWYRWRSMKSRSALCLGKVPGTGSSANIKGASLKVKGKVYRACIQSILGYVNETSAMKVEDMARWREQKE